LTLLHCVEALSHFTLRELRLAYVEDVLRLLHYFFFLARGLYAANSVAARGERVAMNASRSSPLSLLLSLKLNFIAIDAMTNQMSLAQNRLLGFPVRFGLGRLCLRMVQRGLTFR